MATLLLILRPPPQGESCEYTYNGTSTPAEIAQMCARYRVLLARPKRPWLTVVWRVDTQEYSFGAWWPIAARHSADRMPGTPIEITHYFAGGGGTLTVVRGRGQATVCAQVASYAEWRDIPLAGISDGTLDRLIAEWEPWLMGRSMPRGDAARPSRSPCADVGTP